MLRQIDYKGKWFVLQDEDIVLDFMDYEIGKMSKEDALKPEFVKEHNENCLYYGIPAVITSDPDLLETYKEACKKYEREYEKRLEEEE